MSDLSRQLPTQDAMHSAFVQRHGKALQDKLKACTVAICGLGGLGSHIAPLLARGGIGRLILIDFDTVDISNLHRQNYKANQIGMYKTDALVENLREIAPYTHYIAHCAAIDAHNIKTLLNEADIICEAFDDATAKATLVNVVLEQLPHAYIIASSGMAGIGDANDIVTKKISTKFYVCGDGKSEVSQDVPLFASRVSLCASHQAHMAIQLIDQYIEIKDNHHAK